MKSLLQQESVRQEATMVSNEVYFSSEVHCHSFHCSFCVCGTVALTGGKMLRCPFNWSSSFWQSSLYSHITWLHICWFTNVSVITVQNILQAIMILLIHSVWHVYFKEKRKQFRHPTCRSYCVSVGTRCIMIFCPCVSMLLQWTEYLPGTSGRHGVWWCQ